MAMYADDLILLSLLNDYKKLQLEDISILLRQFKSLTKAFEAQQSEILQIIDNNRIRKFLEFRGKINIDTYHREINTLLADKVKILPFTDEEYPFLLKSIEDPPLVLFHKGSLIDFSNCIAVVGTRNLSHYGHKMTRKLCQEIAQEGYAVVSGLARGTDTEAHCGALDVNGKTIAVLASGIKDIYPPENEKLSKDIMKLGALLSEMTTFRKLEKGNFVHRNRITSGISKCLVVIESDGKGGTAHQVRIALDQKRSVFVMKPTGEDASIVNGFFEFVKLGAIPFSSSDDIINFIEKKNIVYSNKLTRKIYEHTLEDFVK